MTVRHYLRPEGFVATPVGNDGRVARLAGGLSWHMAYELIAVAPRGGVSRRLVAVEDAEAEIARLPDAERMTAQRERLAAGRAPLVLGGRTVRLDQPQVMGILNMTPDSFSEGGAHGDADDAAAAGFAMAADGAALVDVGGESTRPGAEPVWEGDEIARVVPAIERLARQGTAVSVDTRKAGVMEAALAAGAAMVNDVSALTGDPRSAAVVAAAGCPVVLMHHVGAGLHDGHVGGDVLTGVYDFLEARVEAAVAAGIDRARIVVDPGIGFGKRLADNLALLNGLALFQALGCAVLLGASRKRLIGALDGEAPVERRLGGSVALALAAIERGAQLVRVHDVAETVQAVRVWRGMRDQALVG